MTAWLVLAALLIAIAGPARADTLIRDYGALTCGDFVRSGKENMGYILWWLRGHHAGKTGENSFDVKDAYAARLGYFCGSHPKENLIETSERILSELARGL